MPGRARAICSWATSTTWSGAPAGARVGGRDVGVRARPGGAELLERVVEDEVARPDLELVLGGAVHGGGQLGGGEAGGGQVGGVGAHLGGGHGALVEGAAAAAVG